jgi:hypothetical protein
MTIADILKKYGPRAGGVLIYNTAKASTALINLNKKQTLISPDTVKRLKIYFPLMDLGSVRIIENAVLPANWFQGPDTVEAMTFGRNIYSIKSKLQDDIDGIKILVHELVHVQQILDLGETGFAARYGEEFMGYGYFNMPLEREAYDFVANISFESCFLS